MGRKADAIHCMGKLWERNFHINPIAVTHLLALCFFMGMIRDVHCPIFHRFSISANIIFSSPIDSPIVIL